MTTLSRRTFLSTPIILGTSAIMAGLTSAVKPRTALAATTQIEDLRDIATAANGVYITSLTLDNAKDFTASSGLKWVDRHRSIGEGKTDTTVLRNIKYLYSMGYRNTDYTNCASVTFENAGYTLAGDSIDVKMELLLYCYHWGYGPDGETQRAVASVEEVRDGDMELVESIGGQSTPSGFWFWSYDFSYEKNSDEKYGHSAHPEANSHNMQRWRMRIYDHASGRELTDLPVIAMFCDLDVYVGAGGGRDEGVIPESGLTSRGPWLPDSWNQWLDIGADNKYMSGTWYRSNSTNGGTKTPEESWECAVAFEAKSGFTFTWTGGGCGTAFDVVTRVKAYPETGDVVKSCDKARASDGDVLTYTIKLPKLPYVAESNEPDDIRVTDKLDTALDWSEAIATSSSSLWAAKVDAKTGIVTFETTATAHGAGLEGKEFSFSIKAPVKLSADPKLRSRVATDGTVSIENSANLTIDQANGKSVSKRSNVVTTVVPAQGGLRLSKSDAALG